MSTCAYCHLPGHMSDPYSGEPCCRVDFEIIVGALDFDDPPFPSAERVLEMYAHVPFTDAERVDWERIVQERFVAGATPEETQT